MHTALRSLLGLALVVNSACSSKSDARTNAPPGAGGPDAAASSGGASNGGASNGGASNGGASGAGTGGASSGGGAATANAGGAAPREAGAGTEASAPVDPCRAARFCETFEGYTAGSPPAGSWKTSTNNGAVTVATDRHFGGKQAARFSTEANSGGKTAFIRLGDPSVFPVPNDAFFGRMMAWLEAAPEASVHWTFIQGGGLVPGQSYHALYRYGGQQPVTQGGSFVGTQLMANYETPDSYGGNGPSSDCWNHSDKTVFPVGKWACVEWQFDGPTNTMRFWLDGTAVDSLTVQGTGQGCVHQPAGFAWNAPVFDTLSLGWESYQADSSRTLYVDDVVLATARVGCPAP